MKIGRIYLIKPTGIRDYMFSHPHGEKPQLGIYIAYDYNRAKDIEDRLKNHGFRDIKIEEIQFESLKYLPLIIRQRFV